jgi:hypothetical protein
MSNAALAETIADAEFLAVSRQFEEMLTSPPDGTATSRRGTGR